MSSSSSPKSRKREQVKTSATNTKKDPSNIGKVEDGPFSPRSISVSLPDFPAPSLRSSSLPRLAYRRPDRPLNLTPTNPPWSCPKISRDRDITNFPTPSTNRYLLLAPLNPPGTTLCYRINQGIALKFTLIVQIRRQQQSIFLAEDVMTKDKMEEI